MDISKDDAVAHLAKWRNADTEVRAAYKTVTGNSSIVGKIAELTPASIKIAGSRCELLLYFRTTSTYNYNDVRQAPTESNKDRVNKYPTVIDIKFGNGDRLEIVENLAE